MDKEEKNQAFIENQKISNWTNLLITILVVLMMAVYFAIGATILVYYSIFVLAVYLFNFLLIRKGKLRLYVWATYTMLTLYMAICTVMLGYNYGFYLYSMSTIPLIYYIKYISVKIGTEDPKPVLWTVLIVFSSLFSSIHSVLVGPVYQVGGIVPLLFLGVNMASVCFFLFVFSRRLVTLVIQSEAKLEEQANHDALTGLANRYLMRKILINSLTAFPKQAWIAMIDIDNFKKINDTYGHKSGDDILKALGKIMQDVCAGCEISRWGGEEFLIYGKTAEVGPEIIEELRKKVERSEIPSNGQLIKFSITSGVAVHDKEVAMDKWVINADNKLYFGKQQGKNRVIF